MKRNLPFWAVVVFLAFCLPTFASAAPNLVGTWKGTVRKVTNAGFPAPVAVTMALSQGLVGTVPGNLFKGTIKVGPVLTAPAIGILGRIKPDLTFEAGGAAIVGGNQIRVGINGKYFPAKAATATTPALPARLQLIDWAYIVNTGNEVYDIATLKK